jgi:hypothetical protein
VFNNISLVKLFLQVNKKMVSSAPFAPEKVIAFSVGYLE